MGDESRGRRSTWVLIVLAAMVFCFIDLVIPLGVAGGVFYVVVVLLALRLPRQSDMAMVAVGCTALTLLGWWLSPQGGEAWKVAFNRGLAVFAIWATAVLGYQFKIGLEARIRSDGAYTPPLIALPIKGLTAAIMLTAAVLIGLGVNAWLSLKTAQSHRANDARLFQLGGDLVYLDEALTMSVRMATSTGQKQWEHRYEGLVQRLDGAIAEAAALAPTAGIADNIAQIRVANDQLVVMERAAFNKIHLGQFDDAESVLAGEAYGRLKGDLASGVSQVVTLVKRQEDLAHDSQEVRTLGVLAAVGVTLPVMCCAWFYAFVTLRHHLAQRKHAELAMQDSQRRLHEQFVEFELLYNTAPVGLCLIDTDLRYVRINERLAAINGLSVSEHIGRPLESVIPSLAHEVEVICRRVIESGQPMMGHEMCGVTPAQPGTQRTWNTGYYPLRDQAGRVSGISMVIDDITEHKRTQDALQEAHDELEQSVARRTSQLAEANTRLKQEIVDRTKVEQAQRRSEHELRVITDNVTGLIAYVDSDMRYRFVNRRYADWFGFRPEAVLGKHPLEVMGEVTYRKVEPLMAQALAGQEVNFETQRSSPNGGDHWMMINYVPDTGGDDGRVAGLFVLVTDITEQKRAEQALQESEQRFDLAVRGSSDGFWDWIVRDGEMWWSPRVYEFLEYDAGEIDSNFEQFLELVHEQDRDRVTQAVEEHLAQQGPYDIEYRLRAKSGKYVWIRARGQAVWDGDGVPVRMSGSVQDITDRKRVEGALQASEKRFRQIFDCSNDAIFLVDPERNLILDANQTAAKMLGYTPEKLLSQPVSAISPQGLKNLQSMAQSVMTEGSGTIEECRFRTGSGKDIPCELSASAIEVGGKPYLLALVRNIADRKHAEKALRLVAEGTSSVVGTDFFESLVRHLAQSLGTKYAMVVEHGRAPVRTVRAVVTWLGDRHGGEFQYEVAGTPCQGPVNGTPTFYASGLQERFPEDEDIKKLGAESYCGIPLFSAEGWVIGHLLVMDDKPMEQDLRDMPMLRIFAARASAELERNRVEQALRDNESRYRALYEDNPSMYFTVDAKGVVLSVNRFGGDQLGYTPQQLVGQSVFGVVYEEDHTIVRDQLDKCLASPGQLFRWEFRKVHSDGSILWVREAGRSVPAHDKDEMVVLIVCEDITYQKQAEDLMRIQNVVLEVSAKGVEMSDALDTLCGFVERIVPQAVCSIMVLDSRSGPLRFAAGPSVPKECAAAYDGLELSERSASCGTAAHLGKPVYVSDTLTDPRWSDFRELAQRFGIMACWSVPVFGEGDSVVGAFAISRSESGRPSAFQRRLLETASRLAGIAIGRQRTQAQVLQHQEELAHVTRLSTVGELASGLAHEINQPLAAISNYVEVCATELRSGHWNQEELTDTMLKASSQCRRASQIISRLRDFICKRAPRRVKVDLNRVIHEAMDLVQTDPRSNLVEIHYDLCEQLQKVAADGIQIEQVIINLAKNSLDAMADNRGHRRRLMVRTIPLDHQAVRVTIKDSGPGLPEGYTGKVFDPFFTTKPDGMGMGLSISRTIIESHGGRMAVVTNSDRGVTFQFTLPTVSGMLT